MKFFATTFKLKCFVLYVTMLNLYVFFLILSLDLTIVLHWVQENICLDRNEILWYNHHIQMILMYLRHAPFVCLFLEYILIIQSYHNKCRETYSCYGPFFQCILIWYCLETVLYYLLSWWWRSNLVFKSLSTLTTHIWPKIRMNSCLVNYKSLTIKKTS